MSTKKKFWVSWIQPTEDFRPINYPPNEQILGWWCSGYDSSDNPIICACVVGIGETIGDRMRSATDAIDIEWPESTSSEENSTGWRFFDEKADDFRTSDRFPLSDWMKERFSQFSMG